MKTKKGANSEAAAQLSQAEQAYKIAARQAQAAKVKAAQAKANLKQAKKNSRQAKKTAKAAKAALASAEQALAKAVKKTRKLAGKNRAIQPQKSASPKSSKPLKNRRITPHPPPKKTAPARPPTATTHSQPPKTTPPSTKSTPSQVTISVPREWEIKTSDSNAPAEKASHPSPVNPLRPPTK